VTDATKRTKLLAHPDEMTRAAVAQQSLSANDIERFVADESPHVRAAVVGQMQITEEQLEKLSNDSSPKVRGAVSGRFFSTPVHLLERLSKDPEPYVRAGAAQQSGNASVLKRLGVDSNEIVRFAVVCNSKTPESVLGDLAKDTSTRKFRLEGNKVTKTPEQEVTIAERAVQHLRQKRHPRSAESFPQPYLRELFGEL
jgi:hypothetical protein